jgi:hypothetical protein
MARDVARRDGIKEGPICLITAVEGCWSYDVKSNRATGHLDRVHAYRKCLHLYHYQIHPQLGFMHTRLQTWLPFNLWVNVNGREWLGRRVDKGITPRFAGEVISDLKSRPEGVRIKHRVNDNSVKMYDKAGSVLRVETTLNDVRDLKSPRRVNGKRVWMPMRKGVADAPRRARVSAASNDRYLDARSAAKTPTPLKTLTEGLSRPVRWKNQSVRGLNPLGHDDAALLAAVGAGDAEAADVACPRADSEGAAHAPVSGQRQKPAGDRRHPSGPRGRHRATGQGRLTRSQSPPENPARKEKRRRSEDRADFRRYNSHLRKSARSVDGSLSFFAFLRVFAVLF